MSEASTRKLGLLGLSAIVFGSMVGGGLFALPQNMGSVAAPAAVVVAWAITAAGILALVLCFKALCDARPDLNAGLYQYAKEGWGTLAGFAIAWGYWLCAAFGNVAYAVMVVDAFGGFWPVLLRHGWEAALFGAVLIWGMFFIIINGLKTAAAINTIISLIKMGAIVLMIALMFIGFNSGLFTSDIWGSDSPDLGGLGTQVKNTMLVTLWCFVGVEGAVIMGSRAKRERDVGRAGVIGFLLAWGLYVMVSLLSYGAMSQAQLGGLSEPSAAYVLRHICGDWAFVMVLLAVIVSLLGGWVAWALICAQVPYQAAAAGIFPARFKRLNRHGMPAYGVFVSSVVMQCFMLMVLMAPQAYLQALDITSMMALPAYLVAALFLCKMSMRPRAMMAPAHWRGVFRYRLLGIAASVYCIWLMYAGGLWLLLETSVFYATGLLIFFEMRRRAHAQPLSRGEWIAVVVLLVAALVSTWRLCTGESTLV